jgi:hypothetical protein
MNNYKGQKSGFAYSVLRSNNILLFSELFLNFFARSARKFWNHFAEQNHPLVSAANGANRFWKVRRSVVYSIGLQTYVNAEKWLGNCELGAGKLFKSGEARLGANEVQLPSVAL